MAVSQADNVSRRRQQQSRVQVLSSHVGHSNAEYQLQQNRNRLRFTDNHGPTVVDPLPDMDVSYDTGIDQPELSNLGSLPWFVKLVGA